MAPTIKTAACLSLSALLLQNAFAKEFNPGDFSNTVFDFVVIGGGSAGLAVATRISDNPSLTVGVIEAGIFRVDDKILIPGMFGATLGDPLYDWNFVTVPQEKLGGRQLPFHRGKILGGTSAINGMVASRASKREYDGLGELGGSEWNFQTIQDGMKKSENWTAPSRLLETNFFANNDPQDHGTQGAIHTTAYTFYPDIVTPFFKAVQNLGVKINQAMSSGDSTGIWTLNGSVEPKNVSRSYSATAYYAPNAGRKNLALVTGAQVTKIITKTVNGMVVATGVQYVANNQTFTVNVRKEVIISAGTIQTPQILELSGIGNKTILEAHSIPVKVDLPGVGENFHDHLGLIPTFQTLSNFTGPDRLAEDPAFAAQQLQQYFQNRTGMYTSTATTLAFLPINQLMAPATAAKLKSDLDAGLKSQPPHLKERFALQRKWLDDPSVPQVEFVLFPSLNSGTLEPGQRYYSVAIFLQHLFSRGSIHISTSDPLAAPSIDGSYLKSPGDFDTKLLVESIKWVHKVSQTAPLKSVTLAVLNPPLNSTDAQLLQFVTDRASTEWHMAGTAAMLPRSQQGVVDHQLKVYGTSNIRVVDASILPVHIATHPTVSLYGIAERVAEALRANQWN